MVARAFERDNLFSLIVGPMVWVAHFLILYVTAAIACAHGFFDDRIQGVPIVQVIGGSATLVALALVLDGFILSWRRWRGRPFDGERAPLPPHDGADVMSRRRFMAYASMLLSGVSLIAIVWESLPLVFFTSCR
jgi:hypothetical protein